MVQLRQPIVIGMEALESDQSVSQDEDGCEDQASKRIKTEPDNDDSLIGLTSIPDHGSAAILTPSSGGALVRLLQGVSTSNGTGLPENVQIIALADSSDSNENVAQWQVLPAGGEGDVPQFFATCVGKADDASGGLLVCTEKGVGGGGDVVGRQDLLSSVVWPQEVLPVQPMPAGSPEWATRMRDCEKIGDSYRGWVASEQELDLLLTYHKQQTGSMWGTRQSPSPARASSRLMWKSQYVPFDGMPFLNAGSRAVVMECQYGPRRKGKDPTLKKPIVDTMKTIYKQTCPARIYVKKVRKYPQFKVNMELSKRNMRAEMDRIFQEMKQLGPELPHVPGEERWYAQLPTDKTHEFHKELASEAARPGGGSREPVSGFSTHRVDAAVVVKLREFVSYGETRVYAIRKRLR
ncbi:PREDICTED: calcium-responsive transcription factor-like isoform X2 [Priapulus caudatus]|uniref:Calcium-responsive transcription factor-like isoform X2 n=1 Tax=Priapulus caudatus TaxID=37621 RepID=A0ABM1EGP9_PRICU|nr:PREDICTED: calcium-responsive transcription factor-like isoform X2 [Priapulus caudatus]